MDAASAKETLEAAVAANLKKSDQKKFDGAGIAGTDGLPSINDISHVMHREIVQSKDSKISGMAWGPGLNDRRVAIADQLGACFVWDTVKTSRMYGCIEKFAQTLCLSPNLEKPAMLVGGMSNASVLYVKEEGKAMLTKKKAWTDHHDGYISSVRFLENGKKFISSSGDADIRVFDVEADASQCVSVMRGHSKDCQSIKFPRNDPSENTFITCSSDKTVKMWDLRSASCTHTFTTSSELNACTIFPDGKLIACGGEMDRTYVFDVRACMQVGKYYRNNMKTASCEFSASGRELFVGHDDGAIIVWDIFGSGDNKKYAKKIEGHTVYMPGSNNSKVDVTRSRVQALDVGPSGFLASAGFDGAVKVWGAPAPKGKGN